MDVRARENIGDENSLLNLDAKLAQQTLGIRLTHEGVKIVASKQVCSKDQLRKEKCSLPINVSKCKQNHKSRKPPYIFIQKREVSKVPVMSRTLFSIDVVQFLSRCDLIHTRTSTT